MKEQVLSIEQMQELKKLGIDISKASCEWSHRPYYGWKYYQKGAGTDSDKEYVPIFSLQDILEMLPSYKITYDKYTKDIDKYEIRIDIPEGQHYITHISQSNDSLLEAAFNMLKWYRTNNYI